MQEIGYHCMNASSVNVCVGITCRYVKGEDYHHDGNQSAHFCADCGGFA